MATYVATMTGHLCDTMLLLAVAYVTYLSTGEPHDAYIQHFHAGISCATITFFCPIMGFSINAPSSITKH
ncbi:hypothetical protein BJV82DRAFT_621847 [Fennellomyces sp. T-0311]|nr:hypothetical protein BJV82DRAFT_621847 [Fennellomyces sp. T-0311]